MYKKIYKKDKNTFDFSKKWDKNGNENWNKKWNDKTKWKMNRLCGKQNMLKPGKTFSL